MMNLPTRRWEAAPPRRESLSSGSIDNRHNVSHQVLQSPRESTRNLTLRRSLSREDSDSEARAQRIETLQLTTKAQIVGPYSIINHGNSDPFSATSVPLTPLNNRLLSAWQPILFDIIWPANPHSSLSLDYRPATLAWVRQCSGAISDEACMHGLLAVSSMLRAADTRDLGLKSRLRRQALVHKTQTLRALKRHFSPIQVAGEEGRSVNEAAICAAYYLGALEIADAGFEEARMHLAAIRSMVAGAGGFRNLTWALKCQAITVDLSVSQSSLTTPIFEFSEWDPGSFSEKLTKEEREMMPCSENLTIIDMQTLFSPQAMGIFRDYRELITIHKIAGGIDNTARRTKFLLWTHLRKYALVGRVINMRLHYRTHHALEVGKGSPSSEAVRYALDLCACIAVRYCEQIVFNAKSGNITVYADFYDLRKILSSPYVCQQGNSGLLLWIFAIGSIIEEILSRHRTMPRWHLLRFFGLLQVLGCGTLEALVAIMSKYLYESLPMDEYLMLLWNNGRDRLLRHIAGTDPQDEEDQEIYEGKGEWFRRNTSNLSTQNLDR